eukprot:6204548-Pleurochrysis_carterae.AAC.3
MHRRAAPMAGSPVSRIEFPLALDAERAQVPHNGVAAPPSPAIASARCCAHDRGADSQRAALISIVRCELEAASP